MNSCPIPVGGRQQVNPQEVVLLEANINYTMLHFADGKKMMVATSLKKLANRFKSEAFFRTHKSFLMNLQYVVGFDEKYNAVMMQNNLRADISRRKRTAFKHCYRSFSLENN
jgi:DNA-binding LytR/AlgR family response regulator